MITSTIQKYAYRVPRAYTRTEPGPQFNATECTSNAETQHNHVVYCHQHYITVRSYKNSYLLFNGATCRFQSSTVFKTRVTGLRLPMNKHWTSPQNVKLQFPYELSFLSVFWITYKTNQKHRLDVVSEVFYGSGRTQNKAHRGIMAFELNLFLTSMPLYMVPESFVCPGS